MAKLTRYFSAWLILAGSKFVILFVGDFFLGSANFMGDYMVC